MTPFSDALLHEKILLRRDFFIYGGMPENAVARALGVCLPDAGRFDRLVNICHRFTVRNRTLRR